jgi:glycosyltransferase involved in cell wall biosynthesis
MDVLDRASNNENAFVIGSLRMGGAESAVRNAILSLSPEKRERTRVYLLSDPAASSYERELGVPVENLNAANVLSAALALRHRFHRDHVRCVHAHLVQAVVASALAVCCSPVSLVTFIHTFGPWKQNPTFWSRIKIMTERLAVNRASRAVVYVSDHARQLHSRTLGYRDDIARVIPNIVHRGFDNNPADHGELIVLSVGRVERIKGFDWVLKLDEYETIFRETRWIIVGDGSYRKALASLVHDFGRRVRIAGAHSDVAPFIREAHVFLMPSYSEGLPVALLEACKAGLPIVATRVGAISEIVSDGVNGFLIEVGDGQGLHLALTALRNPAVRKQMGEASRRLFQARFAPQVLSRKIEELMV